MDGGYVQAEKRGNEDGCSCSFRIGNLSFDVPYRGCDALARRIRCRVYYLEAMNELVSDRKALTQGANQMGMTVEFYSADPQALVSLFAADLASEGENMDAFLEQLKAYPVADFSLHLQTEDLDSLCQSLRKRDPRLPSVFREVLVEQIWEDGPPVTESLTVLADDFARRVAELDEHEMENAARDWATTFPYREPLWPTPAYQALWQLWGVARDVVANRRSLILHLAGHWLF
jgi:hypothetical protein